MGCHEKPHCFYPIKNPASNTNNTINQFYTLTNLRIGILSTVDCNIFNFVCAFNIGITADKHILDHFTILDNRSVTYFPIMPVFVVKPADGKAIKSIHQCLVIPVF